MGETAAPDCFLKETLKLRVEHRHERSIGNGVEESFANGISPFEDSKQQAVVPVPLTDHCGSVSSTDQIPA
jgi:hypothetical protein